MGGCEKLHFYPKKDNTRILKLDGITKFRNSSGNMEKIAIKLWNLWNCLV